MNVVMWAPVVSAGVAVASAAAASVMWLRARGERREAARQAKAATNAATESAEHLARIADVHEQQQQTAAKQQSSLERDPWIFRPPAGRGGEGELYNDSETPKYNVNVKILMGDQLFDETTIEYVGPRRSKTVHAISIAGPMQAVITWFQDEDRTVSPPPQTVEW
ncbi:MAG: hypothetical protein QOJ80_4313 [Mycobacterium sp.]|jgi:hypothetical protein|nr:hypothetical protein [Mycobacterium sp.]